MYSGRAWSVNAACVRFSSQGSRARRRASFSLENVGLGRVGFKKAHAQPTSVNQTLEREEYDDDGEYSSE